MQLEGLALERGSLDKEAAQARRLLDLSTTKSDRDGVLTWVLSQEGALVRRGDVIARIADLSSFRVTATVSDVHAGRLRTGMPVFSGSTTPTCREPSARSSRPSRMACYNSPPRSPSHRTPACGRACAATSSIITDRKARTLRVKRGPFADNAARQAFVVRGDRAVRVPIAHRPRRRRRRRAVVGRQRRATKSSSRTCSDYMHLSEVRIK